MGGDIAWNVGLGVGARIYDPSVVHIGRGSIIGAHSIILGHVGENGKVVVAPVRLGENVLIGTGAIIMPGVTIGNDSVVGAGAVVPKGKTIPPGEIWAGVPARKIRDVPDRSQQSETAPTETSAHASA
jgi:acetyltransferase-like isoleucine patch superfamily enzyme